MTCRSYSTDDDAALIAAVWGGKASWQIAQMLGRSARSIMRRRERLIKLRRLEKMARGVKPKAPWIGLPGGVLMRRIAT